MIFLMEQECVDGGIKFFFKKTPNVLEIENRIVLLYLLNHMKNNTTMKNTILFLLCLLPLISFSQMVYNDGYISVKYVDLLERDRIKDSVLIPSDNKIKTNKVYVVEGNRLPTSKSEYFSNEDLTMFSLNNFVSEYSNDLVLDNYKNPSKITFKNTNFEVFLEKDNRLNFYSGYGFFEFDSIIQYTTNQDFRVEIVYYDGLITSVEFNFDYIGEKTLNSTLKWFNSLSDNQKNLYNISDNQDMINLWIDYQFMNSMSESLPNKNFRNNIVKNEAFSFVFSNNDLNIINKKEW